MTSSEPVQKTAERITGAAVVCRVLAAEGVTDIFGYPGGAVIPIYDEIFRQTAFRHILAGHEQGAAHAADAYARATGRPGVLLVTSGPGATNVVTGVSTANSDCVPMVVITGQVGTASIGTSAFQEVDTPAIFRTCTKACFQVRTIDELAPVLHEAFRLAAEGRSGPVLVDIPKDIQLAETDWTEPALTPAQAAKNTTRPCPPAADIRAALACLLASERPLILTGGGVVHAEAAALVKQFADATGIPVVSTLLGLGAFPADDPAFLGMAGMHGTYEANLALQCCDTLLCLGARLDDRLIGNVPDFERLPRTVVQVDIHPEALSKRVTAQVPLTGDLRAVLSAMLATLPAPNPGARDAQLRIWRTEIGIWRSRQCLAYPDDAKEILPEALVERVQAAAPADTVYTTDVGAHQMHAAQYLKIKAPRTFLTSGGQGTMGFGLPAAVGAAVARPGTPVVCLTGDGSVQMCIQELVTCKRYGLAPKIIIFNNSHLGMVAVWQRLYCEGRLSETTLDDQPDFVALARAYGHESCRCTTYEELDAALNDAFGFHRDKCMVIDVCVKRDEPVLPMVGPGDGLTQMLLREDD